MLFEGEEFNRLVLPARVGFRKKKEAKPINGLTVEQHAENVLFLHNANGGASYSLKNGNMYGTEFYSVVSDDHNSEVIEGALMPEHVGAFIIKHADVLAKPGKMVGTWYNPTDRKNYLGISSLVTSKDTALKMAAKSGQQAVFSLKDGSTHSVSSKRDATQDQPLYIGRHGETPDDVEGRWSGWSDIDLTLRGIQTVTLAAMNLKSKGIKRIVTSPLRRCRHSAEIYSMVLGNIPIVDDWRLASWKLGILEGEIESDDKIRPYVEDPYTPVPGGGTSLASYKMRAVSGVKNAEETNHLLGPSVVLTHSSAIAMWQGGGDILHASHGLSPAGLGISKGFGNKLKIIYEGVEPDAGTVGDEA